MPTNKNSRVSQQDNLIDLDKERKHRGGGGLNNFKKKLEYPRDTTLINAKWRFELNRMKNLIPAYVYDLMNLKDPS